MSALAFESVSRSYGAATALDSVSFAAAEGRFTVVFGPSGAGKSTLLRLLIGLEHPDTGRIALAGRDVTDAPPAGRPLGYVPQSFALYPHYTVRANIAYPLTLAGAPRDRIAAQVDRAAAMLSIEPLLDKTPDQLSGGEKQRVAVARGLSREATVFVLDDPLVGLDYKLRERLMRDLKALRAELDATFLYATADPLEAMTMAQDLVVLEAGRCVQTGETERVYRAPERAATMRLLGFPPANMLSGRLADDAVEASPLHSRERVAATGRAVRVGLRPEALVEGDHGPVTAEGTVTLVEDLGAELVVYLDCDGQSLTVAHAVDAMRRPELGERIAVSAAAEDVAIFDAATGAALGTGAALAAGAA